LHVLDEWEKPEVKVSGAREEKEVKEKMFPTNDVDAIEKPEDGTKKTPQPLKLPRLQ
jgi:hypothetical protein